MFWCELVILADLLCPAYDGRPRRSNKEALGRSCATHHGGAGLQTPAPRALGLVSGLAPCISGVVKLDEIWWTRRNGGNSGCHSVYRAELYYWLPSLRCNSMKVLLWQWDRISISSWLPHVRVGCQPSMRLHPMVWFLEMWLDMNRTIGFSQWIWKHLSGTARSTQSLTGTWSVKH